MRRGLFSFSKVDSVPHHLAQLFERLALREDSMSERSRRVTPFWGVFYSEDDFLVGHDRQPIFQNSD
jgi:hypothetical protein